MPAGACSFGRDQAGPGATASSTQLGILVQGACRSPRSEAERHRLYVKPCGGGISQPLPRTSSERGGVMTCIHDGILRARLDGELAEAELAEVNQHLTACADCRARFEKL